MPSASVESYSEGTKGIDMKIYNTLTRRKEEFEPIREGQVNIYVCGPTVYNYIHIGNARPIVVFDTLRRYMEYRGYKVKYVQNFTDVDDKIINRAKDEGVSALEISERYIKEYFDDADALNVRRADVHPKVSEHIDEIENFVDTLVGKGFAYEADGDVYFSTRKFPEYGKLSGQNIEDLEAGARIAVGEVKEDPIDFALWKARKTEDEIAWESPWGMGRPGWHIECSAMARRHLGTTIDIHGGGEDLQFPHHENEIAQSVGASGHTCGHDHAQTHHGQSIASHVKYWLHNGFIRVDGEKMSKSLGNFFTIREVLKQYDPEVVRFFILRAHYRSPLNYSDAHLDDAKGALTRLYTTLKNTPAAEFELSENANDYTRRFYAAMNDDFGTVEAVAVLFELAGEVNKTNDAYLAGCLKALGGIIGLLQRDPTEFLQGGAVSDGLSNEEIEDLIAQRKQARADKNWAESDRIRDLLNEHKIILEDNAGGTTWRRG